MPLVIISLGGGHTHTHTHKQFQETSRTPGLCSCLNYVDKADKGSSALGLSDYRDSIHYRDSLRLFMKIVDCLTISLVISYKIL